MRTDVHLPLAQTRGRSAFAPTAKSHVDTWSFHDPDGNYVDARDTVDDSIAEAAIGGFSVTWGTAGTAALQHPATCPGWTSTWTITLAQTINKANRVAIAIGTASFASLNGVLAVLPGDVNDDGVVNAQDLVAVERQWLGAVLATICGDGNPTEQDHLAVLKRLGRTLRPAG